MLRQTIVMGMMLVSLTSLPAAVNEGPIRDMQQVIASDPRLSPERKAALERVVLHVLATQPVLDDDKRIHASKDLKCYLDDRIPGTERLTSEQFRVFEQSFRWSLGNYATAPPITEQQRQEMRKAILTLSAGIRSGVDAVYVDTPESVRAELAKKTEGKVAALLASGKVGNYFFPQYLYPPEHEVSPENMRDELKRAMADRRGVFPARAGGQEGATVSEQSRQADVRKFVFQEAIKLELETYAIISHLSGVRKLGAEHFAPLPKEVQEGYRTLHTEMKEQLEQARKRNATRSTGTRNADVAGTQPSTRQLPKSVVP